MVDEEVTSDPLVFLIFGDEVPEYSGRMIDAGSTAVGKFQALGKGWTTYRHFQALNACPQAWRASRTGGRRKLLPSAALNLDWNHQD